MASCSWSSSEFIYEPIPTLTVTIDQRSRQSATLRYSFDLDRPRNVQSSANKNYEISINNHLVQSGVTIIGGIGDLHIADGTYELKNLNPYHSYQIPFSFYLYYGLTWNGKSLNSAFGSGVITINSWAESAGAATVDFIQDNGNNTFTVSTTMGIDGVNNKVSGVQAYYSFTNPYPSWSTCYGNPNATIEDSHMIYQSYGLQTGKNVTFSNIPFELPSPYQKTVYVRAYSLSEQGDNPGGTPKSARLTYYTRPDRPTFSTIQDYGDNRLQIIGQVGDGGANNRSQSVYYTLDTTDPQTSTTAIQKSTVNLFTDYIYNQDAIVTLKARTYGSASNFIWSDLYESNIIECQYYHKPLVIANPIVTYTPQQYNEETGVLDDHVFIINWANCFQGYNSELYNAIQGYCVKVYVNGYPTGIIYSHASHITQMEYINSNLAVGDSINFRIAAYSVNGYGTLTVYTNDAVADSLMTDYITTNTIVVGDNVILGVQAEGKWKKGLCCVKKNGKWIQSNKIYAKHNGKWKIIQ